MAAQRRADHLDRLATNVTARRAMNTRLARELGNDLAADLMPRLRQPEDDFYVSNARHAAAGHVGR